MIDPNKLKVSVRRHAKVRDGCRVPREIAPEDILASNSDGSFKIPELANKYVVVGGSVYYFGPEDAGVEVFEETVIKFE